MLEMPPRSSFLDWDEGSVTPIWHHASTGKSVNYRGFGREVNGNDLAISWFYRSKAADHESDVYGKEVVTHSTFTESKASRQVPKLLSCF